MKSFDEFWETITDDVILEMVSKLNNDLESIKAGTENPKNVLGNQIASCCIHINRELLSHYHAWLTEELSQVPDRQP